MLRPFGVRSNNAAGSTFRTLASFSIIETLARDTAGELSLPGPVELERFLGLELEAGALQDAEGVISASGRMVPANDIEAARQTA